MGRRRGLPEHLPAPRLPGLHLGRPPCWPRQLGLRRAHLPAGGQPGSGELHRLEVRHAVPQLVRGRAVPDQGPGGLEPGVEGALSRVRHARERAAAVRCRRKADGQDRTERRTHELGGRHARNPDCAQDQQPGRHRHVRERGLRLSAGRGPGGTGGRVRSDRGSARGVQEADQGPDAGGVGRQHRHGRRLCEQAQACRSCSPRRSTSTGARPRC